MGGYPWRLTSDAYILTRMPPIAKFSNIPAFSIISSIPRVGIGHNEGGYVRDLSLLACVGIHVTCRRWARWVGEMLKSWHG